MLALGSSYVNTSLRTLELCEQIDFYVLSISSVTGVKGRLRWSIPWTAKEWERKGSPRCCWGGGSLTGGYEDGLWTDSVDEQMTGRDSFSIRYRETPHLESHRTEGTGLQN